MFTSYIVAVSPFLCGGCVASAPLYGTTDRAACNNPKETFWGKLLLVYNYADDKTTHKKQQLQAKHKGIIFRPPNLGKFEVCDLLNQKWGYYNMLQTSNYSYYSYC